MNAQMIIQGIDRNDPKATSAVDVPPEWVEVAHQLDEALPEEAFAQVCALGFDIHRAALRGLDNPLTEMIASRISEQLETVAKRLGFHKEGDETDWISEVACVSARDIVHALTNEDGGAR